MNDDKQMESTAQDTSLPVTAPQAVGDGNIQIDHEYRLSPLVQIPLLGSRFCYSALFIGAVVIFGLGIPDTILDQYFYRPSPLWLLVAVFVLWPLLAYRFWGFQLRKYDIIVKSGVVYRREISIPWSRIQQVDSKANLLDRLCGLKRLVLHSAGSRAGRTSIPGIQIALADALQNHLASIVEKFHGSKAEPSGNVKTMTQNRTPIAQTADEDNKFV